MNNDKFDKITRDRLVCCCDCGKWFPSARVFTKFYSSTAFKNFSFKVLEGIIKDTAAVPDMEEEQEVIE